MYYQEIPYISLKEQETSPVSPESTVMVDMELSFQSGARMGTDLLVTYTLRRLSDGLIWKTGSAKTSDMPDSEGAMQDLTNSLEYAVKATVADIKDLLEGNGN